MDTGEECASTDSLRNIDKIDWPQKSGRQRIKGKSMSKDILSYVTLLTVFFLSFSKLTQRTVMVLLKC